MGFDFSQIRPKGATVSTTHGKACGPVMVMRHYHATGEMVTQSGRRDAALMGTLSCYHPDVREFIHSKDANPQGLRTFNISVVVDNAFMESAMDDPESEPALLLREIAESAWRTGDPGLVFKTRIEQDNPTPELGELMENPCSESLLLDKEPCTLASINLPAHFDTEQSELDWSAIAATVRLMVRYLNDVIDWNTHPLQAVTEADHRTRKIGIGMMGLG